MQNSPEHKFVRRGLSSSYFVVRKNNNKHILKITNKDECSSTARLSCICSPFSCLPLARLWTRPSISPNLKPHPLIGQRVVQRILSRAASFTGQKANFWVSLFRAFLSSELASYSSWFISHRALRTLFRTQYTPCC